MNRAARKAALRARGAEKPSAPLHDAAPKADSYQNFEARLGIGTDNQSGSASYGFNPITRSRQQLEYMYRGSWIVGQAVDCVAEDMTRAGIDITSDIAPDDIDTVQTGFERHGVWQALNDTIKWSRLYGGGLAVILIEGQKLNTPLRLESIGRRQFKGLYSLDRWCVQPAYGKPVSEFGPEMGKPSEYRVTVDAPALGGQSVHYSRIIRMDGIPLPYWQRQSEQGWGMSVIERLYDRLLAFDSTTQGAAQLVFKAHLRTMKVEKLREILASGGAVEAALIKQMEMIRRFQSIEGLTLIDGADDFQTHSYTFSGLSDVLLQFAQQLSGALQIPLVRLFGQSPAGLNATGESDIRTYYDLISQQQESKLRAGVEQLVNIIYRSDVGGDVPDDLSFTFNPLWQMSEMDKATIAANITAAVVAAEGSGLVSRPAALKELRQSADVTGVWSNVTDEEITEAENEPPPLPEMPLAPLGAEGNEEGAAEVLP